MSPGQSDLPTGGVQGLGSVPARPWATQVDFLGLQQLLKQQQSVGLLSPSLLFSESLAEEREACLSFQIEEVNIPPVSFLTRRQFISQPSCTLAAKDV